MNMGSQSVSFWLVQPCVSTNSSQTGYTPWIKAAQLIAWIVLPKLLGSNQGEKVRQLFLLIQQYYSDNVVQQRYSNLTIKMLQKSASKAPKLRGRASEVKGLVLFAKQMADVYCTDRSCGTYSENGRFPFAPRN